MSPQLENGHLRIANELFEAFYRCKLLEYERVIMLCIWRKTYGWNKKEDWVANSQFHEETGIPKPHITRTLKSLREKKIVTKNEKKVTINKNYWMWDVEWRKLPHQVTGVTSPGNKKLPHQVPTKDSKDTKQKTLSETSSLKRDLSLNEKQTMWNKGEEELTIDADGDGQPTAQQKRNTRKYPNAPAVRKVFQEVLGRNPANWRVNKTQLLACENLSTERGLDKIKSALEYYKEHEEDKFCPTIHSPYDLDAKWTKLGEHKLKKV